MGASVGQHDTKPDERQMRPTTKTPNMFACLGTVNVFLRPIAAYKQEPFQERLCNRVILRKPHDLVSRVYKNTLKRKTNKNKEQAKEQNGGFIYT